ncbi:NifU family SUF system FeS assembly protein [Lactobacillus selangorensis]|uniref:NifU family SUF system FeS assembly protein n=1 Tax=Lactobacillus selangorensis TaxID=81857 RepID=A0A0R2FGD0_9LACO|nr:SUF system NifU family Fe-S cluster assembly protein [Lactobacillus selangorensis]KRN27651.1 NifU family SUF system FeS assembly protein [Lactobacillus selangorensis]KRN30382.1 NifU family SUF system FeS assembly protein [Lactobacillus selangorensis]
MSLSNLNQLYRQVLLDHARYPRHQGTLPAPDATLTVHNPTCGDTISLNVAYDGDRLKQITFTGDGCTISQASASMLCDQMTDQPLTTVQAKLDQFDQLVTGTGTATDLLGDAAVFNEIHQFPTRIKCALLAWKALEQLITQKEAQQ